MATETASPLVETMMNDQEDVDVRGGVGYSWVLNVVGVRG